MKKPQQALLAITILMSAVPAAAGDNYEKRVDAKLAKMTLIDFAKGVTTEDDDLSTVAVVSSANSFRINQGILSETQSDVAVKAGIDKKTGRTVFHIHASIGYSGGWRYYQQATYMTPSGPADAKLDVIARNVADCVGLDVLLRRKPCLHHTGRCAPPPLKRFFSMAAQVFATTGARSR